MTCLGQVKDGMNLGKRVATQAQRAGTKISPARKDSVHKAGIRAPEVRHHTLRLFIKSCWRGPHTART